MFATLKNRWILSISVSVLVSLVISGALSLWISQNEMRETLLEEGQKKLTSKKALVAKSVTTYFENIEKLLLEKSKDPSVIESTQQFNDAFSSYMQQRNPSLSDSKRTVADYYQVNFSNEFNSRNKTQADTSLIINKIEPQAIALQSDYIALNEHPLGNKHLLESKNLANDYDRAHKQYHAYMRRFIEFYGFYDAFIVSAETGSIVYSVFKEVDFATNLVTGPFSNSGIAEAFEKANKLSAGETYLTDFSAYLPSYNSPASFISTPIFDGNQRIGVLILQMPINVINNLLTQNQQWSENGFGDTGEVYLVGEDATLRNESRFYVESPQEYIRLVKESNPTLAEEIELKGTSISLKT